jgi:hypothetical protein
MILSLLRVCSFAGSLATGLRLSVVPAHKDAQCGSVPAFSLDSSAVQRIALLLRGDSFRHGVKGIHEVVDASRVRTQINVYHSHVRVIEGLEAEGYQVDVAISTYSTPYDSITKRIFGKKLKVFEKLQREGSTQSTSVLASMLALEEFAWSEKIWYDYVILTRHDIFLHPKFSTLFGQDSFNKKVWLPNQMEPGWWCDGVVQYQSHWTNTSWMSNDFVQIIPAHFWGCVRDLISTHSPDGWPFECWEQLVPFVGSMDAIGFLEEKGEKGLWELCREDQSINQSLTPCQPCQPWKCIITVDDKVA